MRSIRKTLARSAALNAVYHKLREGALSAVCHVSPTLMTRLRYREVWNRWPDLENPVTFDEKLLWLNFYWRHPLKTICGDKYTLRDHVERIGLGHLLPRVYGVYESAEAIDFEALPPEFVLKCSHGSRCNVFCRDKTALDHRQTRRDLNRWLATDYSRLLGELHYAAMKPRILCEEFLDDGTGELPTDYKLYCCNGRVHCTLVCSGRTPNGSARFDYRDLSWNPLPYGQNGYASGHRMPRPRSYDELVAAAEKLAAPFPFVRVDCYCIGTRVVLGEMTFTPSACVDATHSLVATQTLGELIRLPEKLVPR